MPATVLGTHGSGDHASRPAANTVPDGSLYSCTTHGLVYLSNYTGNSWSTWATLGETGVATHLADTSDAHDASAISVLDTATNFTGTDVEAVLAELQDNIDGVSAAAGISYYSRRLAATFANANVTENVNSTSYGVVNAWRFLHDWDFFPATHFLISCFGQSNEAGQTITLQLTPSSDATNPVSSGGDDLVVTNSLGTFSSGWVAVSDAMSGITDMTVARKGSNSTVDIAGRWIDMAFKIA